MAAANLAPQAHTLNDVQTDAVLEAMEGQTLTESMTSTASSGDSLASRGAAAANRPYRKGYSKDILVKNADKFLCIHCKLVLRVPMQSDCGHRFCELCLEQIKNQPGPHRCSACDAEETDPDDIDDPDRGVLNLTSTFSDKAAIREMKRLESKCPNPKCNWTGQFHKYQEHEMSCQFQVVTCDLCNKEVSKGDIDKHRDIQCDKRPVNCEWCRQQMAFDDQEKHKSSCPNGPIRCDKCQKDVPRNDLERHNTNDCEKREIQCIAPGCDVKMPHQQFSNHFTEKENLPKHLMFMYDEMNRLKQEIIQLQGDPAVAGAVAGAEASGGQASAASSAQAPIAGTHGPIQLPPEVKQKLKLHEDLMSVLHGEILRCIQQIEALARELEDSKKNAADSNRKVTFLTTKVQELDTKMTALTTATPPAPMASAALQGNGLGTIVEAGNGTVLWKISEFSQVRRAACNSDLNVRYRDSQVFQTGAFGYRMRLRLFPDGDASTPQAKGMCVYVQLVKGDCDDLLLWPADLKVTTTIIDQKDFTQHKTGSFQSRPNMEAFRRPGDNPNPACGVNTLISIDDLSKLINTYTQADTMFIRVTVGLGDKCQQRINGFSVDPRRAGVATMSR